MKIGNWLSSLRVIIIALITPLLVWILLVIMAGSKTQSFDPNPLIQELVTSPRIFRNDSPHTWYHLVGKDNTWSIKASDGSLRPLEELKFSETRTVLLLEAQGPTLAMQLYHFLKEKNQLTRVLLLSSSDGLLKDLRFHEPQLSMSSGQAYLIRFSALQRLKIQNLMTIDMSAVFIDPKIFAESLTDLVDYFSAHKVAVFIGPLTTSPSPELQKKANILLQ